MSRGRKTFVVDNRGFSVFALDAPQSLRTIRTKLEQAKANRIEQLAYAQDWPDYKRRAGAIEGLDEALQVCDEIEKAERA